MNETSRLAKRYACIEYLLEGGRGRRDERDRRGEEARERKEMGGMRKIKSEKGVCMHAALRGERQRNRGEMCANVRARAKSRAKNEKLERERERERERVVFDPL